MLSFLMANGRGPGLYRGVLQPRSYGCLQQGSSGFLFACGGILELLKNMRDTYNGVVKRKSVLSLFLVGRASKMSRIHSNRQSGRDSTFGLRMRHDLT